MLKYLAPAAVALSLVSVPATAQQVTASSPSSVVSALHSEGYQAQLTKDKDGDPLIKSSSGGAKFVIFFYGCKDGSQCTTIQFYYGFSTPSQFPLARTNEWNRKKRFGRAQVDSSGDPTLEFDLNLDHGGSSLPLFVDNLNIWTVVMGQYRDFIRQTD